MMTRFEWDPAKAESNLRKHHLSFEIATRVFADPFALVEQDQIKSEEHRWRTLGLVEGYLLVLVAHTIRSDKDGTEVIRIIPIVFQDLDGVICLTALLTYVHIGSADQRRRCPGILKYNGYRQVRSIPRIPKFDENFSTSPVSLETSMNKT